VTPELSQIADAVLLAINAAGLSQPLTAVRTQNPESAVEALVAPRCLVVPVSVRSKPLTRNLSEYDNDVHVGLFAPVVTDANAEFDAYLSLSQEVEALFARKRLAGYQPAAHVGSAWRNGEAYRANLFREAKIVAVVLVLTFRTVR
jgi:hypothetical protein